MIAEYRALRLYLERRVVLRGQASNEIRDTELSPIAPTLIAPPPTRAADWRLTGIVAGWREFRLVLSAAPFPSRKSRDLERKHIGAESSIIVSLVATERRIPNSEFRIPRLRSHSIERLNYLHFEGT
jgi:hypothetical protein